MVDLKHIIANSSVEALEDILSPFIKEQFPAFVRADYRKLILLIKAYYEWMEKQDNPGYVISKLDNAYDIDKNADEFYSHFKNAYLEDFPDVLATNTDGNKPNKNTLLKHIRDFYGNKGTENAYQFLFRVLYDSEVEFYYPKNDILKASDGTWIEPLSLKSTSANSTDLFNGAGGQILQYNGTQLSGSADIDYVIQYNQNGLQITEYFIKNLVGTFIPNEEVLVQKEEQTWTERLYSVLGNYFIETPGENYTIGDSVFIQDEKGIGALANIEQVGIGGTVKRIAIKSSGINYTSRVYVTFITSKGKNESAVVYFEPSAITRYPGFFSTNRGKVSSNKKIQDGNYYQDFSYEIKSEVDFEKYFDALNKLVHPSGMRMFGSILLKGAIDTRTTTSAQQTVWTSPIIGNYTPYTTITTTNLRNTGYTGATGTFSGACGDLYPLGYNPYIGSTGETGPNGQTTSAGTIFRYSGLGYTYCVMDEGGYTSHNPIGAPLGSTAAWYRNAESSIQPNSIPGLVCWLKPENLVGANGTSADGISMAIWVDASEKGNDVVAPTWDRWNPAIVYAKRQTFGPNGWYHGLWNINPVKKITFRTGIYGNPVSGVSYTSANLKMVGFWATGGTGPLGGDLALRTSGEAWHRLDYCFYTYNDQNNGIPLALIRQNNGPHDDAIMLPSGATTHDQSTIFGIEHDTVRECIVYTINGIVYKITSGVTASTEFYFDSAFYLAMGEDLEVLGAENTTYTGESLNFSSDVEYSVLDTAADSNYYTMKSFTASEDGNFRLNFSAYIQSGANWFAWRILRTRNGINNDYLVSKYNSDLDTGETGSVHQYRRFVSHIYNAKAGDVYSLQMVSSNSSGTPVAGSGAQRLYAKEFRVYKKNYTTNTVSPSGWTSNGLTFAVIQGYTAWRMAPVIKKNDGGVSGSDGLYFTGSLAFSTQASIHPDNTATRNWLTGLTLESDSSGVAVNTKRWGSSIASPLSSGGFVPKDHTYYWSPTVEIGRTAATHNAYFRRSTGVMPPATETSNAWVFSVYVKRQDGNKGITSAGSGMLLYFGGESGSAANNNIPLFSANDPRVGVEDVGNGWIRFSFGRTASDGATACWLAGVYGLSGGMTLYMSGAQLEKGYHRPRANVLPPNGITSTVRFNTLPQVPFMPNTTTELGISASSMFFRNGLTLDGQADIFMVYRPYTDSYGRDIGVVSSNRFLYDSHFATSYDHVIFSRSYSQTDRQQGLNTAYHTLKADGVWAYPTTIVGNAGFRPLGGLTPRRSSDDKVIVYDPHVSVSTIGTSIGEWTRDGFNVIRGYLNGDEGLNYSRSTGLYVIDYATTNNAPVGFTFDMPIVLGRFGSAMRGNVASYFPNNFIPSVGTTAWFQRGVESSTPYSFQGVINELIIFNRKLEEPERQNVYGYLAKKYKLDSKLPDSFYASHPSTYALGLTYWAISPHPNTLGLSSITASIPFGGITLEKFYNMPYKLYKSIGTRLPSGSTAEVDKYDTIPFDPSGEGDG